MRCGAKARSNQRTAYGAVWLLSLNPQSPQHEGAGKRGGSTHVFDLLHGLHRPVHELPVVLFGPVSPPLQLECRILRRRSKDGIKDSGDS